MLCCREGNSREIIGECQPSNARGKSGLNAIQNFRKALVNANVSWETTEALDDFMVKAVSEAVAMETERCRDIVSRLCNELSDCTPAFVALRIEEALRARSEAAGGAS